MTGCAFAMIPVKIDPGPTTPGLPAAAIPEVRLTIIPAIIVRSGYSDAAEKDRPVVNGVTAIAPVISGVGIARTGRIKSRSIESAADEYPRTR